MGSVTLDGVSIEDFTPSVVDHTTDVAADVATITVTATPAFSGGSPAGAISAGGVSDDADPTTDGHQVDLSTGANVTTITVTAPNGSDTRTHTVTVNRAN